MSEETTQDVNSISEMLVGNYYSGSKISKIFARSPTSIVYKCEGDRSIQYRYTDGDNFSEPVARLESVISEARRKFKGERLDELNPLIVTALRRIFRIEKYSSVEAIISELEASIEKIPGIKAIIGRGPTFCVWLGVSGKVGFRHNGKSESVHKAIGEYTRLKSLADALLPLKSHSSFNRRLGAALVTAFNPKNELDPAQIFAPLEKLIIDSSRNEVKLKLLVITAGISVLLILFATLFYYLAALPNFIKMSMISSAGGIAGALISFLERSKTTNIGESDLGPFIVFSSVSRILLGGLFGAIAFAAANADLAFSLFKGSKPALLILGVAAGFSERLIPDVLGTISASGGKVKVDAEITSISSVSDSVT